MSENDNPLVSFQVFRSSGERDEISIKMSQTLLDLKHAISASTKLGNVPANEQRVFYMGRELKSLNRSLSKVLGSRHAVNVIHFMATARPAQGNLKESTKSCAPDVAVLGEETEEIVVIEDGQGQKPVVTIDLANNEEADDDVVEEVPPPRRVSKRRRRT